MPKIGEIRKIDGRKYIWCSCAECGKERWTRKDNPRKVCKDCRNKSHKNTVCPVCGGYKDFRAKACMGCYLKKPYIKTNPSRGEDCVWYKHGGHGTKLYFVWVNMLQRCFNEKNPQYKNYGGRDIYVEDISWFDFVPFRDWALASGYKEGLSIDRINNDDGYYPANCQWIPQNLNKSKDVLRKAVNQYDSDGNLIAHYYSIKQARKDTGISPNSISDVCRKYNPHRKTAGGFRWEYAS